MQKSGRQHGLRPLRVRFLSAPAVPTPASFPTARPTLPPTADGCAQPLPRSGVAPLAVRGLPGRQGHSAGPPCAPSSCCGTSHDAADVSGARLGSARDSSSRGGRGRAAGWRGGARAPSPPPGPGCGTGRRPRPSRRSRRRPLLRHGSREALGFTRKVRRRPLPLPSRAHPPEGLEAYKSAPSEVPTHLAPRRQGVGSRSRRNGVVWGSGGPWEAGRLTVASCQPFIQAAEAQTPVCEMGVIMKLGPQESDTH